MSKENPSPPERPDETVQEQPAVEEGLPSAEARELKWKQERVAEEEKRALEALRQKMAELIEDPETAERIAYSIKGLRDLSRHIAGRELENLANHNIQLYGGAYAYLSSWAAMTEGPYLEQASRGIPDAKLEEVRKMGFPVESLYRYREYKPNPLREIDIHPQPLTTKQYHVALYALANIVDAADYEDDARRHERRLSLDADVIKFLEDKGAIGPDLDRAKAALRFDIARAHLDSKLATVKESPGLLSDKIKDLIDRGRDAAFEIIEKLK